MRDKVATIATLLMWAAIVAMLMLAIASSGCVTVRPEVPYPYSYHQDNKTCTYWIYHSHWGTPGN